MRTESALDLSRLGKQERQRKERGQSPEHRRLVPYPALRLGATIVSSEADGQPVSQWSGLAPRET